jgi:hypothetical protein
MAISVVLIQYTKDQKNIHEERTTIANSLITRTCEVTAQSKA